MTATFSLTQMLKRLRDSIGIVLVAFNLVAIYISVVPASSLRLEQVFNIFCITLLYLLYHIALLSLLYCIPSLYFILFPRTALL